MTRAIRQSTRTPARSRLRDVTLLRLGRMWQQAVADYRASEKARGGDVAFEKAGEAQLARIWCLQDRMARIRARTLAGAIVKARVVTREYRVNHNLRDDEAVDLDDMEPDTRIAFTLADDVLRLAGRARA